MHAPLFFFCQHVRCCLPPAMEELDDFESDDDVLRHHVVDGELRPPAWGVIYKSREEAEAHMEAWGGEKRDRQPQCGAATRCVCTPSPSGVTPPTHSSRVISTTNSLPRPCTHPLLTDGGPVTWVCRHPQDAAWGARKDTPVHAKGEFKRSAGKDAKKDGDSNKFVQGAIAAHRVGERQCLGCVVV